MKKIILLILILLSTGCFEDSGKLTTTCTKKENINTLYRETTYIVKFKADMISNVEVIYYHKDDNIDTLSSIKTSIDSTDQFINGLKKETLINNDNEFKVSYKINTNDSKEIKEKFKIQEKRSELIKALKENGFECK